MKTRNGLLTEIGKVWIPDDTAQLKVSLLAKAQAGATGHSGVDTTYQILRERLYWTDHRSDIYALISYCVLYSSSKRKERIPLRLSSMVHATEPSVVLHLNYLFVGGGDTDLKYVLVPKDDLSCYF